jgi:hypothetical protein
MGLKKVARRAELARTCRVFVIIRSRASNGPTKDARIAHLRRGSSPRPRFLQPPVIDLATMPSISPQGGRITSHGLTGPRRYTARACENV